MFLLQSSSNDASVDVVDDESSFEFSPKTEFTLNLQQSLKYNHCTSNNCRTVKDMLQLLAFKWLLIL